MARHDRLAERYFDAGLAILADEGFGGLKLATLCKRLSVTTGAFYHSFSSWADFTQRLLEHWRVARTTTLIEIVTAEPDPRARLQMLLRTATSLPFRAEAAIRLWSDMDPDAARVQRQVDDERYAVVRTTFAMLMPEEQARHFAAAALYLVTGFELAGELQDVTSLTLALNMLIDRA